MALASIPLERLLYRRLYGGNELDQVLLTIGLVFMSVAAATIFGDRCSSLCSLPAMAERPGRSRLPQLSGLSQLSDPLRRGLGDGAYGSGLERTLFGAQLRAAVDNPRMAQSVGIDTSRLFMRDLCSRQRARRLGRRARCRSVADQSRLCAENLIYFLIVVAVGGLGSIRGPFFAALLLGVADTASKYLVPEFGAFFIYALTLAVLLWRPRGLFGRA